jgi:Ni,Fe-hydrogenase III large subunit
MLDLTAGRVTSLTLDTPSARHLALVKTVTDQAELADALVAVASLDLSPWEMLA